MTAAQHRVDKQEEICRMCKRPKNQHTPQEMESCMRKMNEFQTKTEGGAGIQ